jgi:hypothetical protein
MAMIVLGDRAAEICDGGRSALPILDTGSDEVRRARSVSAMATALPLGPQHNSAPWASLPINSTTTPGWQSITPLHGSNSLLVYRGEGRGAELGSFCLYCAVGGESEEMWMLIVPLVWQCGKSLQLSKGRLLGTGAAVLGTKVGASKRAPLVYVPLKDVEVVALLQLP